MCMIKLVRKKINIKMMKNYETNQKTLMFKFLFH